MVGRQCGQGFRRFAYRGVPCRWPVTQYSYSVGVDMTVLRQLVEIVAADVTSSGRTCQRNAGLMAAVWRREKQTSETTVHWCWGAQL